MYWPWAFRKLIAQVLSFIVQKPELWNELSSPDINVNQQYL
jgi:hypothetical protein